MHAASDLFSERALSSEIQTHTYSSRATLPLPVNPKFTCFTSPKVKILTLMRLPGEDERVERESREEREEREETEEGPQASEDMDAFSSDMRRLVRRG